MTACSSSQILFSVNASERKVSSRFEGFSSHSQMGWHCITIWECELKPSKREETLRSLAFTLNKIWLEEHAVIGKPYPKLEEEDGMLKAAEERA